MGEHRRTVTTKDVARDMAVSPQRVREMQRAGYFHMAKLVNPRKRNYVWWDNAEFAKFRKMWRRTAPRPKATKARRRNQRRQEKINELLEILRNKMRVTKLEKELAIWHCRCLSALLKARHGWAPRPIYPLLEGIQAMYESRWFYAGKEWVSIFDYFLDSEKDLEEQIEQLPIRSPGLFEVGHEYPAKPQTEQSPLNASARLRTTLSRRARRRVRDNY
jgi:hypothetical protein